MYYTVKGTDFINNKKSILVCAKERKLKPKSYARF